MTIEDDAAAYLARLAKEGDELFVKMCDDRHAMGSEKYGPVKFLEVDSIEMALEEVTDMANYMRYTFIKLYILQQQLASQMQPEMLGPTSFISAQKDN